MATGTNEVRRGIFGLTSEDDEVLDAVAKFGGRHIHEAREDSGIARGLDASLLFAALKREGALVEGFSRDDVIGSVERLAGQVVIDAPTGPTINELDTPERPLQTC